MDMERISRVGIRAAYRAGEILNDFFNRSFKVSKKGDIDLVTEADVASEQAVIATISDSFPDHAILAEESGGSGGAGPYEWIIDPLDGTTNFAHRLPLFAVSIACRLETQMIFGCVFNPVNNELFSAVRGQGAQLNGQPVCTSRVGTVAESLLVTGFPYTVRTIAPEAILSRFTRCLTAAQGVRRLGSAALDLCCVACGRFDGFWEE
ncbi:MAG: inositol monophosphatase, partial [Desulfatitalea sp.]|nr:inositol monophosphatase [Desulfatitalea sp.]NNK01177.1 inositol monophosphatase [Desulfatitalea sp.]